MGNDGTERRKYKRVPIKTKVEFVLFRAISQAILSNINNGKIIAETENISAGGLQIVTDIDLPQEQIVRLKILPVDSASFNAHAMVRWSTFDNAKANFKIGLEFFYLNDNCREYISNLTGERAI